MCIRDRENTDSIDYADKSAFHWVSVIRLPDFITPDDFAWAVQTAEKKKKLDCSKEMCIRDRT